MSINVEFEQLDRESKVNENIYKADRNFEKVKGALANARHKNDIIPAGDIVFPDNAKFVEVLAEINKKYKEIQNLVRGINVNVQGTVLETQFMKKATFDNDNDGVVDNTKMLNGIVKAIDFTGKFQKEAYRKTVIALCEITNENASLYSYTQGEFYFRRYNGLHPAISIKVNAQKNYNQAKMMINAISFGTNKGCVKPCTFDYNNKTYGGIEFYYDPAEHSKIEFAGLTNFEIFGVDYYNTYTKSAINEEIANSIDYSTKVNKYNRVYINDVEISGFELNISGTNEIILGKNFNQDNGDVVINHRGALKPITKYHFRNGMGSTYASIKVKTVEAENITTLEQRIQALEQRIQALERKTQNL